MVSILLRYPKITGGIHQVIESMPNGMLNILTELPIL